VRDLAVYCADVGSVENQRFGWARGLWAPNAVELTHGSEAITELVEELNVDLQSGRPVALGFECPLFVPVRDNPNELTWGREGEGSPAWSSNVGATVLATGLAQTVWILNRVRQSGVSAFLDWPDFGDAGTGLFLWEAFIAADAKGDHLQDAVTGVSLLAERVSVGVESVVLERPVHSLIGAALLRTGWSKDLSLLHTPCVVLKA